MSVRRQDPPFCIQVELSEGCNLYCGFCGLQGIREQGAKNYKFMSEDMVRSLGRQVHELRSEGWNPRVEFAMHGEPTMHPDYVGMIRAFCEEAPRAPVMMTSNGGGLLRRPGPLANVTALFEAGLGTLALDEYEGVGIVPRIRKELLGAAYEERDKLMLLDAGHVQVALGDLSVDCWSYPERHEGNPHQRGPRSRRMISFVRDIVQATAGTHAVLTNHAGAGGLSLAEPLMERCAKPFREIGVRWDGRMAMCCNDWRGVFKVGSVVTDGLAACWHAPQMEAARRALYAGRRDVIPPCSVCDYRTYRNGLLPDKMGKEQMPPYDARRDKRTIDLCCSGRSYAEPVLRPWEVKT